MGPRVRRRYDRPGTFSEILEARDSAGQIDYDFAIVQVQDADARGSRLSTIHAAYSPTLNIRPGQPVTFKVRTFEAANAEETWNFGDGFPTVTVRSDGNANAHAAHGYAVTTHRFPRAGDYIVRVERTRPAGAPAIAHLHVHVQ